MRFTQLSPLVRIYGDRDYRGPCAKEWVEQVDFVSWVRCHHEDVAGLLIAPLNEGATKGNGYAAHDKKVKMGMNVGASDVLIIAPPVPFVNELKRLDHTKSSISKDEVKFLNNAAEMGCFTVLCLGFEASKQAFLDWRELHGKPWS